MLTEKMEKALNEQVNKEYFSSYLYLSMVEYFQSINLKGFASWMRVQAQEEMIHATKFMTFINDRNGRVVLDKIEKPQTEWASPLAVFEDAYTHEQFISKSIHQIMDQAREEKDHPTVSFLNWFVDEQVEEEATALDVVDNLKMVGDNKQGLFMLDQQMAERQAPAPEGSGQ